MMAVLTAGAPSRGLVSHGGVFVIVLSAAAVMGAALAWLPILALLPFAALVGVLLLVNAPFRTAFVVFGGLAVLQSSQELSLIKFGYLLGTGVALLGALYNLQRLEATRSYRLLRPLLSLSLLFASLVALSLGVSIAHGTPMTAWLRDAAPYFLFAAVPVFTLDLHSAAPRKLLVAMFVIAGVLASLSYTVEWLDRRSLADLPFSRIVLPSGGLRSALYIYALSGALLSSRGRTGWIALSALILSLTWITSNRADSLALLLVAPVVGVFAAKQDGNPVAPALRWVTVSSVALLLALVFTQSLARLNEFDTGRLMGHLGTITSVSFSLVSSSPATDQSYRERAGETRVAWRTFRSEPVLGAGPGHLFEWPTASGDPKVSFNIDTALSFPAKFGIAGIMLLLALALAFVSFLRNVGRGSRLTVPQVALVGYAALVFLGLPFSSHLEDKGFSFGLLFLLALSLPEERETGQTEPTSDRVRGRDVD